MSRRQRAQQKSAEKPASIFRPGDPGKHRRRDPHLTPALVTDPAAPARATLQPTPCVVLDTNVVLDWLHFDDPRCRALARAIQDGDLQWVVTQAMREELEHVLTRVPFSTRADLGSAILDAWTLRSTLQAAPAATASGCRCTDPDDQKFIDLALHLGPATLLISRDRAVLRLARAAARHGVQIVSVGDWTAAPLMGAPRLAG